MADVAEHEEDADNDDLRKYPYRRVTTTMTRLLWEVQLWRLIYWQRPKDEDGNNGDDDDTLGQYFFFRLSRSNHLPFILLPVILLGPFASLAFFCCFLSISRSLS